MIDFGPINRKDAWFLSKLCEYFAERELFVSTKEKQTHIMLAFEKVMHPFILYSKKNYAGPHFEGKGKWIKPAYINMKGLETVRRDKAAIVKEMVKEMFEMLFEPYMNYPISDPNKGVINAYNYLCDIVKKLLERKIPMNKFISTKRISKEVYAAKQVHVELAKKMAKRDPGSAPKLGDRVKYVLVDKGLKALACEMGEDPIYALQNNIPIAIEYYLTKKIIPVIESRFSCIFTREQLEDALMGYMKVRRTKSEEKRLKTPDVYVDVETHSVIKKIVKPPITKRRGTIGFFFKKKVRCSKCKKVTKGSVLCSSCKKKDEYKKEMEEEERELEERMKDILEKCRECQGVELEGIVCTNDDCPTFYEKYQVRTCLMEQRDKMRMLDW